MLLLFEDTGSNPWDFFRIIYFSVTPPVQKVLVLLNTGEKNYSNQASTFWDFIECLFKPGSLPGSPAQDSKAFMSNSKKDE